MKLSAPVVVALSIVCGGWGPAAPAAEWPQVIVRLDVRHGAPVLSFDGPSPFAIDPRALRFLLRSYDGDRVADGPPQPANVAAGPAQMQPQHPADANHRIDVPLRMTAPPKSGMYELLIAGGPGTARTPSGEDATTTLDRSPLPIAVWWPDERDGDPGLRDTRARFAHRIVHGLGGITVGCPGSTEQHGAAPGVRIGDVTRAAGSAAMLQTGSLVGSAGDVGFRFLAVDPLVFAIADERGVPYGTKSRFGSCVLAWRFADPWHADTALTTSKPPRGLDADRAPTAYARIGMSRDDIAWRNGYPNRYGTVAMFRAQPVWNYDAQAPFGWWVRFDGDRVTEVHSPGRLP